MSAVVQLSVDLCTINCNCGGVYAITEGYRANKHLHGGSWHCPYCQAGWGYTNAGQLEKAKKELAGQVERTQAALNRANAAEQQLAAVTAQAERAATRAKNGTCPCCTRTFKQLAAHMKNKHPEYKA